MKRILSRHALFLALSLLGTGLQAQNELPQVFSPNAAELGKYGKIPVSYFNGLPNISIPLTELHAKGYTLPVYLTYHAGGNKPDQHPGWVGLGWTLHAGGCINRIAHGMKDEMTMAEAQDSNPWNYSDDPGYYYHASDYQRIQIDSSVLAGTFSVTPPDMDPDEFQVNFEGLNSSFYFVGADSIKIASQNAVDYTVHVEIAPSEIHDLYGNHWLPVTQHNYIRTIEITAGDGVVYRFGGTDSAIDYSYDIVTPGADSFSINRSPTSWKISLIRFPSGEEIRFEYQKAGVPIIALERHYSELCDRNLLSPLDTNGYTYTTEGDGYKYINYTLIEPSYLKRIKAQKTGEAISFAISPTVEKADPVDSVCFKNKITYHLHRMQYSLCMSENKYQKLDSIESPRGKILLNYTSSAQERLKLMSITVNSNRIEKQFKMRYNNLKLPDYRSRNTDMWGFYSRSQNHDETGRYYQADEESSKAEILEVLEYPTGGETRFEYELHQYGKVVQQDPFVLIPENGVAGGLRIKSITDKLGEKEETREFRYIDTNGDPSGVMAAKPRFSASGKVRLSFVYMKRNDTTHYSVPVDSANYYLSGERLLNQIPLTGGNHVTYTRVEERFPDASKKVFYYSNHEDMPDEPYLQRLTTYDDTGLFNSFCSNELSRGLLLKEESYSSNASVPVRLEELHYSRDTLNYVQAINQIKHCNTLLSRSSHVLYYTYHPYLSRKRVILYSDDNSGNPYIETTEYTYDSHRRLTGTTRKVGGARERDSLTYTGNYAVHPYSEMAQKNMISYPVEHLKYWKDTLQAEKLVSAELTTWTQSDSLYLPSAKYKGALGAGISPSSFYPYAGNTKDSHYGSIPEVSFTKYDGSGNLILSEDRSGTPTSYVWTQDGCHPAAIFTGSRNGFRTEILETETDGSVWQDLNLLSSGSSIDLEFTCDRSGLVEVFLDFVKAYGRTVWWRIDYGTENQWEWPNLGPEEELEEQTLFSGNLPAGDHVFQVTAVQGNYTEMEEDEEEPEEEPDGGMGHGPWALVTYGRFPEPALQNPVSWGSINVSFPSTEEEIEEIRADDCLFEDFEDNASSTYEGFHGGKSFNGVKALDFEPYPDKYYVIDWQERQSDGSWRYRSKTVDGQGSFTAGNLGKTIDHVRVFPVGTTVESYTWNPAGNLTSRTDSRGVTESYRYDGLGRLVGVYDNDENIVEEYQYNYQNRGNE